MMGDAARRRNASEQVRFYCIHDPDRMFTGRFLPKGSFLASLERRVLPEHSVWYRASRSRAGDGAVVVDGPSTCLEPKADDCPTEREAPQCMIEYGGPLDFNGRTRFVLAQMTRWIERREPGPPTEQDFLE